MLRTSHAIRVSKAEIDDSVLFLLQKFPDDTGVSLRTGRVLRVPIHGKTGAPKPAPAPVCQLSSLPIEPTIDLNQENESE